MADMTTREILDLIQRRSRLDQIFQQNPYMAEIYPSADSRQALEVFQIYQGSGEVFDLSQRPIFRQPFSFGGERTTAHGYFVHAEKCIACGKCNDVCPQDCITHEGPRVIDPSHCLHCGRCLEVCPTGAVERR